MLWHERTIESVVVFTWAQAPDIPGRTGNLPWAFQPDWLDNVSPWYVDEGLAPEPAPGRGPSKPLFFPPVIRRRRRVDDDELVIIGTL